MQKELTMKKFIIGIIVMAFVVVVSITSAYAEIVATTQSIENVSIFAHKAIPDVSHEEIEKCYDAVKNGGSYTIERKRVKIECSEEEMIVFRRFF